MALGKALRVPPVADRPGVATFAVVGLLYWIGASLGGQLTMTPEHVSLLWPSNAVLLAVLARYRGQSWGLFAGVAVVAEVVADAPNVSVSAALVFGGANVVEVSVAWLLLRAWGFDPRFERVEDVGRFVLAGPVVAALVGAIVGTLFLALVEGIESPVPAALLLWWFGDGLGLLVFTPMLLGFWIADRTPPSVVRFRPIVDTAVIVGGVVLTAVLLLAEGHSVHGIQLRPVLLLPLVVYAAIRLPLRWTCVLVAGVAILFVALTVTGHSPYGPGTPELQLIWAQEFVLVASLLALGLSALLRQVQVREETIRKANLELGRRAEALAQSNKELHRIAFVTAHDLQTPLRSISRFTQLLLSEIPREAAPFAQDWVRRVTANTERLEALLRDLGMLAEVDATDAPFETVDMETVVDAVVRDLTGAIEEAGAVLTRDPLPVVRGVRHLLHLLVQELIRNALKFCGARPPVIHVSGRAEPSEWVFSVRDNGVGIPAEARPRVFDLFQRLPSAQDIPGTGFGLALCSRVVQRHGGRIWIESAPDGGCVFHFTIQREEPA